MIYYLGETKEKEFKCSLKKPERMVTMNKDNVELGVAVGSAVVSCVAGTIESVIKHRAIFKKDGISEKEKEICKKACYVKWGSSIVYGVSLGDLMRRSIKEFDKANEEFVKELVEEIGKEMK